VKREAATADMLVPAPASGSLSFTPDETGRRAARLANTALTTDRSVGAYATRSAAVSDHGSAHGVM